jgi:hypothetical protein
MMVTYPAHSNAKGFIMQRLVAMLLTLATLCGIGEYLRFKYEIDSEQPTTSEQVEIRTYDPSTGKVTTEQAIMKTIFLKRTLLTSR